jgi:threonine dehydratase
VEALVLIAERLKVLAEPAASCTLAAAERRAGSFGDGARVVLVLCGGNVALDEIAEWRHTPHGSPTGGAGRPAGPV